MIELKKGNHYVAIAFVAWDSGDWMVCVWNDQEDTQHLQYRFRYYVDDRAFDSSDEKRWYEASGPVMSDDAAINILRAAMTSIALATEAHVADLIIICGDYKSAFRALHAAPWVHIKMERGGDTDDQGC